MENFVYVWLWEVVVIGNVKVVCEVINEGVFVNYMDVNGWILFYLVVSRGKECVLRVLLEKGGDVFVRDFVGGFIVFYYVVMYGCIRIVKLLLDFKGLDKEKFVDVRSEDGWIFLYVVVYYGRDLFVELFFELKGYVDVLSDKGIIVF